MLGARRGQVAVSRVARARLAQRLGAASSGSINASVSAAVRSLHASRAVAAGGRRSGADDSEAALAQQMLDFMKLAEEEEAGAGDADADAAHAPLSAVQAELPVRGVVMGVQNGLARVSGLRHATIGSVVDVSDARGQSLCAGLVLFLEKKVVHVALLHAGGQARAVARGMDVQLQREQLEIPGSVAAFAGAVVDPLGRAVRLEEQDEQDASKQQQQAANDRVKVTWGAQSVPGLMARAPLRSPFETGLLAVDCLRPMAHGHRFGVLGPRNSGKTRVALDVIAHQVARAKARGEQPPQFVYVCVGKSAARVHQIRDALQLTGALEHTTIVASTDRDSPVLQYLAPFTGCAVAEFLMYNGKSPRSVVVYDDLATHTTVVEGIVQSLKLPRAAQLSLSAHAVLMERSAQFKGASKKEEGPSLTSLVLVDAPDSLEIPSEFQERVTSLVDDYVGLESSLARSRVFPPVDVLAPGASVRGPPFQSATRWTFVSRLRARINAAAQVKQNVEVARKLGFETEPEDAETLEFLELVQQFFTQKPLLSTTTPAPEQKAPTELETELGAFFLTIVDMAHLPGSDGVEDTPLNLWEFLHDVVARLSREENQDIMHQLTTHSRRKAWSLDLQENVALTLFEELEAIKQRRTQEYKEEQAKRKQYLRKLQELKSGKPRQTKA
ncbi:H - or Na -translocating F-type, V-type and A-type ATPase (F-ATPase) Superfamily [Phytophthora cinnamomi]|uniref:H - or Na -translocating F-type, V-type and A-type ATPase (F-ATPase) Superfamily n=1 Tax=Phytophthora cinnamomi TaxID=4785 RepID=UPI0035599D25|nr:H - or Na -translocating F-type, V-type and A-type ATPase (F-ATPase) Superfamily [Phytophthora cinnamomi]